MKTAARDIPFVDEVYAPLNGAANKAPLVVHRAISREHLAPRKSGPHAAGEGLRAGAKPWKALALALAAGIVLGRLAG